MRESTKTWQYLRDNEREVLLSGKVLDIGCGCSPIIRDARCFDRGDGDANRILDYIDGQYDVVWSSHCLEHLCDPGKSICDFWELVKSGGKLMVLVPDEDYYEQGYWPSVFNEDHKHSFTFCKQNSQYPNSVNILDLIQSLAFKYNNVNDYSVRMMCDGYNIMRSSVHYPKWFVKFVAKVRYLFASKIPILLYIVDFIFGFTMVPRDQTLRKACAQWLITIKKM